MTDIRAKCSEGPERIGCDWLNPELLGGRECGSASKNGPDVSKPRFM